MAELWRRAVDVVHAFLTGFAAPPLQADIDTVLGVDGLVAFTPVFSASCSGLFTSFSDVVEHRARRAGAELAGAMVARGPARPVDTVGRSLPFEQLLADVPAG